MSDLREFMDMIDVELRQRVKATLTDIPDQGRLATKMEVITWINHALAKFSGINSAFWSKIEKHIVLSDSESITLPFYWKRLDSITISGVHYRVGLMTDINKEFYHEQGNTIVSRNGKFTAGTEIYFSGIFRPSKINYTPAYDLVVPSLDYDLNQYIDLDEDWIGLLKLQVVIFYASGLNVAMPYTYAELQTELRRFEKATPPVVKQGRWKNTVNFGSF